MKIAWNEEQKKVIETRNADILVSAAAGSGKTAVLVERITRLICDEGVSFDELIVMTFTKAAALFGLTEMPPWYFTFLLAVVLLYMLLTTVIKGFYQKRYRELI